MNNTQNSSIMDESDSDTNIDYKNYVPVQRLETLQSGISCASLNVFVDFLFFDFLVKMWFLKACFLFNFPEAVFLKRLEAPELVFIFGMISYLFDQNWGANVSIFFDLKYICSIF